MGLTEQGKQRLAEAADRHRAQTPVAPDQLRDLVERTTSVTVDPDITPELAALVALRAAHLAAEEARATDLAEVREAERVELVAAVRAARAAGASATRIARALGISRQRLYALAGSALTNNTGA